MNDYSARSALIGLLSVAFVSQLSAQTLDNGDFESWTSGDPDSWTKAGGITPSEVTGLDGSGSAAIIAGTNSSSTLYQDFTTMTGAFTLNVDFQLLTTGNALGSDSRTFNMFLRDSGNVISANTRLDNTGNFQMYDGSNWKTLVDAGGSQSELITSASTDVYRLTLDGFFDEQSGSNSYYNITIYNLTDDVVAGSATGITYFHYAAARNDLANITFGRGNSSSDYIIDNVSIVPEPRASALIGGICVLVVSLVRRRA
ncbi:hypothetical protein [Coraliomargarita parva]|uniref:hypothetical protein n=1 Tax=Coraliomargarita parva TaxID=3014050 RepID=UPI0022B2B12D|nr:hypothetical protein [Coraliomargarita parva]